jgi:hypothetical protein
MNASMPRSGLAQFWHKNEMESPIFATFPAGGTDAPRTPHIAVYSGGILAWVEEPPCFDEKVAPQPPPIWIP